MTELRDKTWVSASIDHVVLMLFQDPLERAYLHMTDECTMSKTAKAKGWEFMFQNAQQIMAMGARYRSFATLRRRNDNTLPPIWLDYQAQFPGDSGASDDEQTSGVIRMLKVKRARGLHLKKYNVRRNWLKVVVGYITVRDVVAFHRSLHQDAGLPCQEARVMLAIDGIAESRSTSVSLVVFAIRFEGCRNVYPICITRPSAGYRFNREPWLRKIIQDLNKNGITVDTVVADAPERKELKRLKSHNAFYGCCVCTARGQSIYTKTGQMVIVGQTKKGGGATVRVYPHPEVIGRVSPVRTNEELRTLGELWTTLNRKEQGKRAEELKGAQGISILHTLAGEPDVVQSCAPEYMHWLCLGIVKTLINLTFEVKTSKKVRRRKRMAVAVLNKYLREVLLPTEFARRTRDLDVPSWKADEFKVFALYSAVIAIKYQPRDVDRKLWAYFTFLVRAYLLPDEEYKQIAKQVLHEANHRVLRIIQDHFGKRFLISNTHIFSHMEVLRRWARGPFTRTSAFPFEGHFARIRAAICVGAPNTVKTILTTIYTRAREANHRCTRRFHVSMRRTTRTSDREFYTWSEQAGYVFYELTEDTPRGQDNVTARRIVTQPSLLSDSLAWDLVGVHQISAQQDDSLQRTVPTADIAGKAVVVEDQILSAPPNILLE
jgi:hypothetical protein